MYRNRPALMLYAAAVLPLMIGMPAHAACTAGNPNANVVESTPSSEFVDNNDGTVTHLKTGLMWKKCAEGISGASCGTGSGKPFSWDQALKAVITANAGAFAGHRDWRLPHPNELASVVEYCGFNPAINQIAFPGSANIGFFWTGTTYNAFPSEAWLLTYSDGHITSSSKANSLAYARLVRSTSAVDSFDALARGIMSAEISAIELLLLD